MSCAITPEILSSPEALATIEELYDTSRSLGVGSSSYQAPRERANLLRDRDIECFAGSMKLVIPLTKHWVIKIVEEHAIWSLNEECRFLENLSEEDKYWFPLTFRLREDMVLQERFDVNHELYFAGVYDGDEDGEGCTNKWYELAAVLGCTGDVHANNIGFRENGDPVFIDF